MEFYSMRKLLTLKDLLQIVPISEATARRYIASGDLTPVSRPGCKLLFRPEDVESWTASRQQQPPPNIEPPTERKKRHAAAMQSLKQKGVTLPSQK
jgi:hypothetical protein